MSHSTSYPGFGEDKCTRIKVESDDQKSLDSGVSTYKITSYTNLKDDLGEWVYSATGDWAIPTHMFMMSSDNLKAYVKNWWIDDEPEVGVDFLSTRTSFFNMKHRTNFHFLSNDPTDNIVVYMCRDFTGNSWPTWLFDHLYGEAFWALTRQNPGTATDTGET